jgi:hypothetical protein
MKIGIPSSYLFCFILTCFYKLLYYRRRNKDLVVFLNSPLYSDGHFRRFANFESLFKKNNLSFHINYVTDEKTYQNVMFNSTENHVKYRFYLNIAFIRARQIPKAIKYKNIIVQRSLFPYYPDYSSLFFERMLCWLGGNRILDIWDPVHLWHPKLTYGSFKFYNKITVNKNLLKEDYQKHFSPTNIIIWPIAVDTTKYLKGNNTSDTIKLFYTGSVGNTKAYLEPIIPILERLSNRFQLELNVVGAFAPSSEKLLIIHNKWSETAIKKVIECSDFGLYPNFQAEKTKNYAVAGKVLDYMSAKLPIIGADQGLPEGIDIHRAIFKAECIEDWEQKLIEAFTSRELAEEKALYAFDYVKEKLNTESVFNILYKEVLVK